jgi:FMN phosphatase YigB (HAD superfamily)
MRQKPSNGILVPWMLLLLALPATHGQVVREEDRSLAFPASIVAVFFDVGGTLAYRDPETGKFAWYSDALSSADALKGLGLRVGLLSNVPRGWDEAMLARLLLEPEPLDELFEPVVLAQSPPPPGYPPPKPDPLAFQNAVARLGPNVAPVQVLYVGEDRDEVQGARLAGLQATLLVRRGRPPRDDPSAIRDLGQLVELLTREGR